MFGAPRPRRLRRPQVSRLVGRMRIGEPFTATTLALALLTTVAIELPASAQNAACGRCSDNSIHIGPFSFPNPFASRGPPDDGVRGEEPRSRRRSSDTHERRQGSGVGGSMFVCVRTCDGSFFPLPYSGASGATLEEVCQTLCPNVAVELYTMPFGGTIDAGASLTGARYTALPNAFKFQQTFDPACSCRRPGQSWADALAAAEKRFGHRSHDIIVTVEASAEMARPKPSAAVPATARNAVPPGDAAPGAAESVDSALDIEGVDTRLKAATAAVSRETSGIEDGQRNAAVHLGLKAGRVVEDRGPDGGTRRVRVLTPSF